MNKYKSYESIVKTLIEHDINTISWKEVEKEVKVNRKTAIEVLYMELKYIIDEGNLTDKELLFYQIQKARVMEWIA